MELTGDQASAPRPALPPHRYPAWVCAFVGIVALLTIYSAVHIPRYFRAASAMDRAAALGAAGHHRQATQILLAAFRTLPDSTRVRIEFAYQAFQCPDTHDHVMALAALQGLNITAEQWRRLKPVIPPEYLARFHAVESE